MCSGNLTALEGGTRSFAVIDARREFVRRLSGDNVEIDLDGSKTQMALIRMTFLDQTA
jgi:hypothetical protein